MRFLSRWRHAELVWDASDDVAYAATGEAPTSVHIFPIGATGVRAAACYAPGHKLSVGPQHEVNIPLLTKEFSKRAIKTVFFHGFFPSLPMMARALANAGAKCLAVWHGAAAQLCWDAEKTGLACLIELRREQVIRRLGATKPGLHAIHEAIEHEPWLNFAPRVAPAPPKTVCTGWGVLPTPVNWVKNFHTNMYAGAKENRLTQLRVTKASLQDIGDKALLPRKLAFSPCASTTAFFAEMSSADIVLNASLSECQQPMVALEAAAHGTPCLTPRIGVLDTHDYVRLCTVDDPTSIHSIARALSRVLDLVHGDPRGLSHLQRDFLSTHQKYAAENFNVWLDC